MFDARRAERPAADGNGYVETDPTGRYGRFDEVLGKGAMKIVYRAFDELNGLEVAWNQAKLCDVLRSPEALQRMYSEVHLLSTLDHESIIRFHTSWIDNGHRTFNFITELFTSGTLRGYRQRYRRVDIRAVKSWARQILHGLVYLHGHDPPVIHRDLKCDNIFVNGHLGQIKIGDLGLAAVLRGSQNAHSVIGTPEFMAPELYEEEYNELVDIYSFGMCVLEMLTSEYPYSECTNPAQIYKKVTSGKLPGAFHRIHDPEARRFIGRCLEGASKRSTAKELLLDPFLRSDDRHIPAPASGGVAPLDGHGELQLPEVRERRSPSRRTDMTITGKMNPVDHTIFLKVLMADKDGDMRNVYFPFDIVSDTPIDVAKEMVKELEITGREPSEIAEVIAREISVLVPDWKEGDPPQEHHHPQVYSLKEDGEDDGLIHPFYYLSSPSSSHVSEFEPGYSHGDHHRLGDWIRDELFSDDDDKSSMHSGKYSCMNYHYEEPDADPRLHQAQPNLKHLKQTRFGPEDGGGADAALAAKFSRQCNVLPPEASGASTSRGGSRAAADGGRMTRNRSMVDVRSQVLRRTLVEELNKRLFKTVGAVENIGFQPPCDGGGSRKGSSSRVDRKRQGNNLWGLGRFF